MAPQILSRNSVVDSGFPPLRVSLKLLIDAINFLFAKHCFYRRIIEKGRTVRKAIVLKLMIFMEKPKVIKSMWQTVKLFCFINDNLLRVVSSCRRRLLMFEITNSIIEFLLIADKDSLPLDHLSYAVFLSLFIGCQLKTDFYLDSDICCPWFDITSYQRRYEEILWYRDYGWHDIIHLMQCYSLWTHCMEKSLTQLQMTEIYLSSLENQES